MRQQVVRMLRGTICVERMFQGKREWMPLADQESYQEWVGCFSLLRSM